MKKRIVTRLLAVSCVVVLGVGLLAGCGKTVAEDRKSKGEKTESTMQATKKRILVVSFGTSYNDSRNITIGGIENSVREAYPDYEVRRAFTSQIIIDKLKKRDGLEINNVKQALDEAVNDGVTELVVQPTHLMDGIEYNDLKKEVDKYKKKFKKVSLGEPLLTDDEDYEKVVKAITARTASYDDGQTAICFMGHGTDAESNKDYAKLQEVVTKDGFENYYIGTVEATPSVDDLIKAVNEKGKYKKVVLMPLMVVAGDHANNDMAGDDEDSWKSKFEAAGYDVTCILEGLGQNYDVEQIYVQHTKDAIKKLN